MKKYIIQLIFVIFGLVVFVKEVYDLAHTDFWHLQLNSQFMFYYLKCVFYYLALPIFFVSEALEFFGVLPEKSINDLHLHFFYNVICFFLTLYGLFFVIGRFI